MYPEPPHRPPGKLGDRSLKLLTVDTLHAHAVSHAGHLSNLSNPSIASLFRVNSCRLLAWPGLALGKRT